MFLYDESLVIVPYAHEPSRMTIDVSVAVRKVNIPRNWKMIVLLILFTMHFPAYLEVIIHNLISLWSMLHSTYILMSRILLPLLIVP